MSAIAEVIKTKAAALEVAPYLKQMYEVPGALCWGLFYLEDGEAVFAALDGTGKTVKF
jgi:uncharacterized pyridoxamine 5'-phosphate oxidase family protein